MPREGVRYRCIASIAIDFVMKIKNKNYPLVYLEECKYKVKKKKKSEFIDAELKSESELESGSEWL